MISRYCWAVLQFSLSFPVSWLGMVRLKSPGHLWPELAFTYFFLTSGHIRHTSLLILKKRVAHLRKIRDVSLYSSLRVLGFWVPWLLDLAPCPHLAGIALAWLAIKCEGSIPLICTICRFQWCNTSTMADFRPPTWNCWTMQSWEEMCTTGFWENKPLALGLLESQEAAELVGNTVFQCITSMCQGMHLGGRMIETFLNIAKCQPKGTCLIPSSLTFGFLLIFSLPGSSAEGMEGNVKSSPFFLTALYSSLQMQVPWLYQLLITSWISGIL